jgi:hypothetical protein
MIAEMRSQVEQITAAKVLSDPVGDGLVLRAAHPATVRVPPARHHGLGSQAVGSTVSEV